jgi:hypothetical protein
VKTRVGGRYRRGNVRPLRNRGAYGAVVAAGAQIA